MREPVVPSIDQNVLDAEQNLVDAVAEFEDKVFAIDNESVHHFTISWNNLRFEGIHDAKIKMNYLQELIGLVSGLVLDNSVPSAAVTELFEYSSGIIANHLSDDAKAAVSGLIGKEVEQYNVASVAGAHASGNPTGFLEVLYELMARTNQAA